MGARNDNVFAYVLILPMKKTIYLFIIKYINMCGDTNTDVWRRPPRQKKLFIHHSTTFDKPNHLELSNSRSHIFEKGNSNIIKYYLYIW